MKERVISTKAEFDTIVTEMKEKGLKLACMSNAGLPLGKARLTFIEERFATKPMEKADAKKSNP